MLLFGGEACCHIGIASWNAEGRGMSTDTLTKTCDGGRIDEYVIKVANGGAIMPAPGVEGGTANNSAVTLRCWAQVAKSRSLC